jgi:dolichol-phosphate mannosyltransferase
MSLDTKERLSLVIPAYNEEGCIENTACELINEFMSTDVHLELVLVDNGSNDNTSKILNDLKKRFSNVKVVTVRVNEGYGWGVICGLKNARADYVGYMGADGQITARDTVRVFERLKYENLDLCKSRRIKREDGVIRSFLSKSFNTIFYLLYHVSVNDVNGTPKIMRYDCCQLLDLESRDWFLDAELLIKAASIGLEIGEVDVIFNKRNKGQSNVKITTIFEFIKNLIKYRFKGDIS